MTSGISGRTINLSSLLSCSFRGDRSVGDFDFDLLLDFPGESFFFLVFIFFNDFFLDIDTGESCGESESLLPVRLGEGKSKSIGYCFVSFLAYTFAAYLTSPLSFRMDSYRLIRS